MELNFLPRWRLVQQYAIEQWSTKVFAWQVGKDFLIIKKLSRKEVNTFGIYQERKS